MSARTLAYVPLPYVDDALRLGWCWGHDRRLVHHDVYSEPMWRCDCERRHLVPAGMRWADLARTHIDGIEMPAEAGCWGGSAP